MEFFQFHPTGIYRLGILISEAARGEGGILLNNDGERFMERYAPTLKDLAPRDMVSRCMFQEIAKAAASAARTTSTSTCATWAAKCSTRRSRTSPISCAIYQGLEPERDLIPTHPTAHYAMGGIPTNFDAEVILDDKDTPMPGFYAAGECACVSHPRRQPTRHQQPGRHRRVRSTRRQEDGRVHAPERPARVAARTRTALARDLVDRLCTAPGPRAWARSAPRCSR